MNLEPLKQPFKDLFRMLLCRCLNNSRWNNITLESILLSSNICYITSKNWGGNRFSFFFDFIHLKIRKSKYKYDMNKYIILYTVTVSQATYVDKYCAFSDLNLLSQTEYLVKHCSSKRATFRDKCKFCFFLLYYN